MTEQEKKDGLVGRRRFLRSALATAGVASIAGGWKPSKAYSLAGSQRVVGANERINIGIIGTGGMGNTHLGYLVEAIRRKEENAAVIGVCDIFEPRRLRAQETAFRQWDDGQAAGKVEAHHDYRKLLENKDIDVVWIVTPDHWHAKQAIEAMEAGKDIYLEKPMTRYVTEAHQVYQTAIRTQRVVQIGSQWTSEPKWRIAAQLVAEGKIGKVVWSQTSYCRNSREGEWNYGIDPNAKPGVNLDWDAFLGPAPKRPWDPERFFRWRKFWDYSGGIATDLFPHMLHTLFLVIGPEFPTRVVAIGGIFVHYDREVPDTFHLMAEFPSGHIVVVAGSTANERGLETLIRGHKGNLEFGLNAIMIRPERVYADELDPQKIPFEPIGDPLKAHHKNFLECVRDRTKTPNCPIDLAYKVMIVVGLAELSYREGRMKIFDPNTKRVIA
ncbi:MAG: Gfo/Idh/MocA family oxidoreductase [Armatimonadetes bacterium]|nr:Gfo/Idh/MocA family oxidoreductase [Armatimonadota bacterium]MDW8120942.1 Gfo/Idh/MocA family oxidoreductase [Armatimonadota bacterium]